MIAHILGPTGIGAEVLIVAGGVLAYIGVNRLRDNRGFGKMARRVAR